MSALEFLLSALPHVNRQRLLLAVGPHSCCRLLQTSKRLFRMVASDDLLWQRLYVEAHAFEDDKEQELVSTLRARDLLRAKAAEERENELLDADEASASDVDDDLFTASHANDQSGWQPAVLENQDRVTSNLPSPTPQRKLSSACPSLTLRDECCWWLRVFAERHAIMRNWYQNRTHLRVVRIPPQFGKICKFSAGHGPWVTAYLDNKQLLLGYIGEMPAQRQRTQQPRWRKLPLARAWLGRSLTGIPFASINAKLVIAVAVYGTEDVLCAWHLSDGQPTCFVPLGHKGYVDSMLDDYAVVVPTTGACTSLPPRLFHLDTGYDYCVARHLSTTNWHLQRADPSGPVVYSTHERNGIVEWALHRFSHRTASTAPPIRLAGGRLELLSNLHHLTHTLRIDAHRVLLNLSFFDSTSETIAIHDLNANMSRVPWSCPISGRSLRPIASEDLIIVFGQCCSVLSMKTGCMLHGMDEQIGPVLQRTLGSIIGEGAWHDAEAIRVGDLATGAIMYSLHNTLVAKSDKRTYISAGACYIVEAFCNLPLQMFVWDFTSRV
ncbi:hypothetical protein THASP1DRAFT_31479 [Thamnocephalis sphaerospora]|uniref:F-box domain-containing protein n=1 Tax=Thamnocephalis sphaerospora TaxID=78915 RepID=A0A4P9XLG1_9FUNG|nr:hypothetical protein THASP1DRAFT_31479 [Thamnocephalis sphaerospora]|eukprot:RKP06704.1 hypothetical protein THASP1DRAFT_31479 [Thamnocephalis sphaerospora]